MSRIDDLIEELCPNGVSFEPLGKIAKFKKGYQLKPADWRPGAYPIVTAAKSSQKSHADWNVLGPCITMASHGVPGYINYWNGPIWLANNVFHVLPDDSIVTPSYLYYALKMLEPKIMERTHTGGIPYVNSRDITTILVPVPPIIVQREIAQILDTFTQLEAELEAELESRNQQYEVCRSEVLHFERSTEWTSLEKVTQIRTGTKPPSELIATEAPFNYMNGGVQPSGRTLECNTAAETITIPSRGSVGIVGYQSRRFWCGPLCYRITSSVDTLETRFLYFYLKSIQKRIISLQQTGSIPALNKKELATVRVPMITRSEQSRIVTILNTFDNLINDLTSGLPAEIAARRQQYEQYRNQLLTFKRLPR